MRSRAGAALATALGVVALVLIAFTVLIDPFRQFETETAAALLHLLGVAPERVQIRANASLGVYPASAGPFLATVTPSCSSLSAVVAVASLALFVPRHVRRRRFLALGIALLVVVGGNILRIAASIAIGLAAGTGSLVLFHDWVGSLFAFTYTLGGYLLMLYVLMSANRRPDAVGRDTRVRTT